MPAGESSRLTAFRDAAPYAVGSHNAHFKMVRSEGDKPGAIFCREDWSRDRPLDKCNTTSAARHARKTTKVGSIPILAQGKTLYGSFQLLGSCSNVQSLSGSRLQHHSCIVHGFARIRLACRSWAQGRFLPNGVVLRQGPALRCASHNCGVRAA